MATVTKNTRKPLPLNGRRREVTRDARYELKMKSSNKNRLFAAAVAVGVYSAARVVEALIEGAFLEDYLKKSGALEKFNEIMQENRNA